MRALVGPLVVGAQGFTTHTFLFLIAAADHFFLAALNTKNKRGCFLLTTKPCLYLEGHHWQAPRPGGGGKQTEPWIRLWSGWKGPPERGKSKGANAEKIRRKGGKNTIEGWDSSRGGRN